MTRQNEFSGWVKRQVIERQGGKCAFCGVLLETPWTEGEYRGYAHHLCPIRFGGSAELDNCVYLCWGHHLLVGHGMAPFGIDKQGGSSSTWVQIDKNEFAYWDG